MKSGRRLITIVVAAVAVLVLVLSMLNLVPSTEPANSAGPPYPDPGANVKATDQQGGYLTDGTLSWEAVAPNPTTGALDHIAGVTFILVGTQANWDGSSAQAGSQMTIVDCVAPSPCTGSGDQDDRAGYFRISRSSGLEAQEFMYRVWEVTAPAGYNAMYPVNSYSYDTPAQPGVVRSDNLYFYPNYSWQPGQPVNGWYFGQFMNYPLPVQISWSKTNADTGAKITGALFNLYKGNQVLAYSNVADCVNEPCAGPDSNPSLGDYTVSGITAVDFGNWQVLEVQAPAGYDLPNPNQAKSVNLSEWNTKPDLGAFPNAPTPPPPPADPIPDLTFTKVDAANLNTFLPHSEWKLDFSTGSDIDKLLDCAGSSENDCRNQYAPAEYGFDLDPDVGEFRVELATTHIGDTAVMYEITPPPGYAINPAFAESSGSDLGTIICADADDPSCHKDLGKITNSAVYPTLMWAKTDTNGNALADSTWSLAEQNKWDTTATYIVDYTGQTSYQCNSTVVPDNNILCDLDARPGYFRIHDILLQGPNKVFELREKTAPAGYQAINTTFTSDPLSEPTCTYQFCTLTDGKCDTAADGTYSAIFNQIIKPTLAWHIVNTFTPADDLLGTVWSLSMVGSTSVTRSISDWTGEPGYTGLDRDPRASHFLIAGVSPGTWRLGESVCPVGYDCIEPQYIKPVTVGPEQAGVFTDDYPDSNVHNSYIPPIVDWTKTDSQRQPLGDSVWAFCPIYDNHPQGDCDESLVGEFAHILDLTDTAYGHGDHNPAKGAVDIWSGFFWDDGNIYADRGALHEVSAPFGYICDKTIQPYSQTCASGGLALATATVGPGTYVNLGAFQNDQFPEITWTKVYNDGTEDIPLGGARFYVMNSHSTEAYVDDCYNVEVCEQDFFKDQDVRAGYFSIFVPASLDSGEMWSVSEAVNGAPPGFTRDSKTSSNDNVTINQTYNFGSFTNTVKLPVVNFRKVDAQTPGKPLAGAVFRVTVGALGSSTDYTVTDNAPPKKDTDVYDADSRDGYFSLVNLPQTADNPVIIEESVAPASEYIINDTQVIRTLCPTDPGCGTIDITEPFVNHTYPVVKFIKADAAQFASALAAGRATQDALDQSVVGGSEWLVQAWDQDKTPTSFTLKDYQGEATYDGYDLDARPGYFEFIASDNQPWSRWEYPALKWTINETNAPAGLQKIDVTLSAADDPLSADISYETQTYIDTSPSAPIHIPHPVFPDQLYVFNMPITGQLTWSKTDTAGKILSDATFSVLNSSFGTLDDYLITDCAKDPCAPELPTYDATNSWIMSWDSDARAGYFELKNLKMGDWNLREAKAPTGYVLSSSIPIGVLDYRASSTTSSSFGTFVNELPCPDGSNPPCSTTPTPNPSGSTSSSTPNPDPSKTSESGSIPMPSVSNSSSSASSSSQPKPQPSKSTAPKPQPSSGGSGSSSFDDCATNPKCYHYADSSVTRWSKRSASPNPDTIFDDYDYSIVQAVYSNDDSASDTPDNSLTTYLWLGGSVLAVAGGLVLGAIRPWSRRKLEKLS